MHPLIYAARRLSWLRKAGAPDGIKHALGCMLEWCEAGKPETPMHRLDMSLDRYAATIDYDTGRVWPIPRLLREGEAVVASVPRPPLTPSLPRGLEVVGYIPTEGGNSAAWVVVAESAPAEVASTASRG